MKIIRAFALVLALALLCGALPASAAGKYQLGDTVEDFSLTLLDGREVSLYALLQEKDAVVLNFWASWCGPCRMEFPYMQQAYDQLNDEIEIIALSIEETDTPEVIEAFKGENGITTIPMGQDPGLYPHFGDGSIPTTAIIDRNGVLCFLEAGAVTDVDTFVNLFSNFTPDDYSEAVLVEEMPRPEMPIYSIAFFDADTHESVTGVTVQVCDAASCMVFETGDSDTLAFYGPAYPYELHVLSAPEGYALPDQDFVFPAEGGDLVCMLEKE